MSVTREDLALSRGARFRITSFEPDRIVIRDVGPWSKHKTITNDAEGVIKRLDPAPGQRVFYYDSEGNLDELVHEDGKFVRFAPGPSMQERFPGHPGDGY